MAGRPKAGARARELLETADGSLRVTAVRPDPRAPGTVAVYAGRVRLGRLDTDAAVRLGVKEGRAVDRALAQAMLAEMDRAGARAAALRLLGVKSRSRADLVRRLRMKGYPAEASEAAADRMAEVGLLDDRRYAEAVAASELRRKPAGEALLSAKLRSKGVAGPVAAEVAKEAREGRDELADAVEVARRAVRRQPKGIEEEALRRRVLGALARRGFGGDVSRRALERALRRG